MILTNRECFLSQSKSASFWAVAIQHDGTMQSLHLLVAGAHFGGLSRGILSPQLQLTTLTNASLTSAQVPLQSLQFLLVD